MNVFSPEVNERIPAGSVDKPKTDEIWVVGYELVCDVAVCLKRPLSVVSRTVKLVYLCVKQLKYDIEYQDTI